MKHTEITAEPRENLTKAATKTLRKDEKVPGVVYNNGKAEHIALSYIDAKRILFTEDTYIINLDLDGNTTSTIVREAQYHPVTDRILHLDLLAVDETKPVEVVLPVEFYGTPKGAIKGGKLMIKLRKLKVKGLPTVLPETIRIDIKDLDLGQSIKVGDVKAQLPDLNITSGDSAAVAGVEIPRALRSTGPGEEGEMEDEEGEEEEEENAEE